MDDSTDIKLKSIIAAIDNDENVLICGPGGCGKCLDPNTEVILHNGKLKKAKNVEVDDLLMGDDSTPRKVLSTCSGTDLMYKLITNQGDEVIVNSQHILTLKDTRDSQIIDISIQDYLCSSQKELCLYRVPIKFNNTVLLKDPYTLNIFLEGIPDEYLFTSIFNRQRLATKILDTYCILQKGVHQIAIYDIQLQSRIVYLFRSIGYNCYVYDIVIYITEGESLLTFQIKPLGKGSYNGFTLDGNGRFLLSSFIVTHNSYSLCHIAKHLRDEGKIAYCTASTGIAAINLNNPAEKISASTLHSWAGVGLATDIASKLVTKVESKSNARKRWRNAQVLIIDEISMIGGDLFDKLDYVGRAIRQNDSQVFGGLQLVLCGDLLQLPPVKDEFIFNSCAWKEMPITPFFLETPKRYDDVEFFNLLLRIRNGEPTKDDIKKLQARVQAYHKFNYRMESITDKTQVIKPTKFSSYRRNVDNINDRELSKLEGPAYQFNAVDVTKQYTKNFHRDYYLSALKDASPECVCIKIGAQVMLKCNKDVQRGLVNGSRGVVIDVTTGFNDLFEEVEIVIVKFLRGITEPISRHVWEVEDKDGYGRRTQIPLALAWAATIHRSQGCTLDYAIVDLGSTIFAKGQAYVGLSRVRNLRGLFLSEFDPTSIMVSKEALRYTRELKAREKLLDDVDQPEDYQSDISNTAIDIINKYDLVPEFDDRDIKEFENFVEYSIRDDITDENMRNDIIDCIVDIISKLPSEVVLE